MQAGPGKTTRTAKTFGVGKLSQGRGEKIGIHGDSGEGKSTLAALAPKCVFIGLDDGGEKLIVHGEALTFVEPRPETFADLRDCLHQKAIYEGHETVVIDTLTRAEDLAVQDVFDHYTPKDGWPAGQEKSIESYGYGAGYGYLYDTMLRLFADCDALVRQGKNLILIMQTTTGMVPNPAGLDWTRSEPRLFKPTARSSKGLGDVRAYAVEWFDHLFYLRSFVDVSPKAKGKGVGERQIYYTSRPEFLAKSRTLCTPLRGTEFQEFIPFNGPEDDTLWKLLFQQPE